MSDLRTILVQNTHSGDDPAGWRHRVRARLHARDRARPPRQVGAELRISHDRYQRTDDGWKFTGRVYEVRYADTTPLTGSPPASPS